MADFDFYKATKRFILGEVRQSEPSMQSYLRSLEEMLNNFSSRSQADGDRKEMALEALRGVKRHCRRLREKNIKLAEERDRLQERLSILEENKDE